MRSSPSGEESVAAQQFAQRFELERAPAGVGK